MPQGCCTLTLAMQATYLIDAEADVGSHEIGIEVLRLLLGSVLCGNGVIKLMHDLQ
jgi:hypothetical protein